MKRKLLFLGMIVFCINIFAKNLVLTSIQPTYAIAKELTEGTGIKVESVFTSGISMDMAREAMLGEDFIEPKQKPDAVIDIAKVWLDDNLFEKIRSKNIRTVEIDATYPFDTEKSTLFFIYDKNGRVIPYVWMGSKNLIKLASIIVKDLVALYPKEQKKLEKNLTKFYKKTLEIEKYGNEVFLNCENTEVICLSPNIKYFLNDFNIYAEEINPEDVTVESVEKIITKTGIKVFASDRWLKKKVVKAIKAAGGSFVVLDTLNIPIDKDEKMDEEAIWKSYKKNIDVLKQALNK